MDVVVFDTEAEANTQQDLDYTCWMESHSGGNYIAGTTRWATPKERLDGKWSYPKCEGQTYVGITIETFDPANYAQPDEL